MKQYFFLLPAILLISLQSAKSQVWPASLAGQWQFDVLSNPLQATVGQNLVLHGSHINVSGTEPMDGAYAISTGSYYECQHGIAPNGGGSGSYVNEYSILIDFKIPDATAWHCFYQTNAANSNDGEIFMNTYGNIGLSTTGYSGFAVMRNVWHRLLITVDLGNFFRYYLDGKLICEATSQSLDGRFSLDPTLLFFADDNAEDGEIHVSQIALFNTALSTQEVFDLGGFNASLLHPYLQSPTPNSIYVSWLSAQTSSTFIQYGLTNSLGLLASGTYEDISGNLWHTVKLTGLLPDTTYYYRCISGNDTSVVYPFQTPHLNSTSGKHLRFVKLGDSQTHFNISKPLADSLKSKLIELYGTSWYKEVDCIMHTGDIVGVGSTINSYQAEFFNTFADLSCSVPVMISIGNHEEESANFYKFMKYEDFSDYSSPNILNEKFYSFTLGNAQFIILNSNGLYNTTEQTTWLGNKLAVSDVNPDIDFVFTFSHQPGLTELWPDGNTSYVWSNVMGAIAQYPKATIHFGGHSHCYERGYYYGTSTQKRDFRTVVSGGMGGTLDRWGDYSNQTNYQTTHRSLDHYNYVIIDVDIDSKSYSGKTFSMGHPQKSLANVLVDFWHGKANQAAPEAPLALYPYLSANTAPVLIASPFSGLDTLFSSQFQISASEGNWLNPVFNSIRDMENYYGSTGNPDYYPVDMNTNIDIQRCAVTAGLLTSGTTYWWRVRYRDKNLRWSNWSLDQAFTVEPNLADAADFTADVTSGNLPLTVHFTDISNNSPLSWEWDFDNDGVIDSYEQDPVFTYTSPGLYSVALTSYFSTQNLTETKTNYINVLPSNVDFNSEKTDFVIYPNPVDKILMLDFISDEIAKEISISISDLSGRKILEFTKSCSNKVFLDVSMFDSGIYILKVQNENKEYKRMIFIVK